MTSIDIVLPLGGGSAHHNLELRIALRSICKHARGWRRVVIVGEDPGFLAESDRVAVFPIAEALGNKEYRIAAKVLWAFESEAAQVTDYVAFWNDDYVLQKPTDVRRIPFYHRGGLLDGATRQSGRYRKALEETHDALAAAGRRTLHYDVHLPIVYNRQLFLSLSSWWELSRKSQAGFVVKSTYANNILEKPGPYASDCKLRSASRPEMVSQKIRDRWLFSYGDVAMKTGLADLLRQWYPDPCELEKGGARARARPVAVREAIC